MTNKIVPCFWGFVLNFQSVIACMLLCDQHGLPVLPVVGPCLLAAQVAKLLNCTPEDVAILVSAGKLRPLGRPNPNAVKFFSAVELIALLADREWLDEATKTIGQFWKRKNARRNGLTVGIQTKDVSVAVD